MVMDLNYHVEKNMKSAITLLHPIALLNSDKQLRQTFFDVENGAAICGFRRKVANFGVLLVKAQYGRRDMEVEIGPNENMRRNGSYFYTEKVYKESNEGLLGGEQKDGQRQRVDFAVATNMIKEIKDNVEHRYSVHLSPMTIFNFMTSRYRDIGGNHQNTKINLHFTAGQPAGTAVGEAVRRPDDTVAMMFKVKGNVILSSIAQDSNVPARRIQPGRVYLTEPLPINKQTGERTVNVLRTYKEGMRIALQSFSMGLIKPGDRAYDVNPGSPGITERTVVDMPFMPNQPINRIKGAPMLTFDLDMFYVLMKTLSGYPSVTMQFRDSSSGVYFSAEGHEYTPHMEAIMGPTVQYVRGKIWLP